MMHDVLRMMAGQKDKNAWKIKQCYEKEVKEAPIYHGTLAIPSWLHDKTR